MSTAFWALVRKDIQLFLMDRRAVIMSFAVPILIASFFGYIFGGGGNRENTARIPILVADQDGSAVSHEIIASLAKQKTLDVKPADVATARDQVRRGKATVAVIIPKDFGQNSARAFFGNPNSEKPEVSLLYDPSHSAERGMIEGVLTGEIMQAVSKEMFSGATGHDMVNEALGQIEKSDSMLPQDKRVLENLLRSVQQLNSSQGRGA